MDSDLDSKLIDVNSRDESARRLRHSFAGYKHLSIHFIKLCLLTLHKLHDLILLYGSVTIILLRLRFTSSPVFLIYILEVCY